MLLGSQATPERQEVYRTFGVTVIVFDASTLPGEVSKFSPNILRWVTIWDYLKSLPLGKYKWLMVCDISDTVFQLDPFYKVRSSIPFVTRSHTPLWVALVDS